MKAALSLLALISVFASGSAFADFQHIGVFGDYGSQAEKLWKAVYDTQEVPAYDIPGEPGGIKFTVNGILCLNEGYADPKYSFFTCNKPSTENNASARTIFRILKSWGVPIEGAMGTEGFAPGVILTCAEHGPSFPYRYGCEVRFPKE